MQRFGKIDPVAVNSIIPHLKEVITNVEHMRGAGRDGKLRYYCKTYYCNRNFMVKLKLISETNFIN